MKPLFDSAPTQAATQTTTVVGGGATAGRDSIDTIIDTVNKTVPTIAASVPQEQITDEMIEALGAQHANSAANISRQILSQTKASDTDKFGEQLNELVATAKKLDPAKMGTGGLMGTLRGLFGNVKERLDAEFQTVEQRMNVLCAEMDKSAGLMESRVKDLEQMFTDNENAYQFLGAEINRAVQIYEILEQQLAAMGTPTDGFAAQKVADHQARMNRCEKRIDDLKRGQQLCLLAAPEIRSMQDNNRTVAGSFRDIKVTTIPAWLGVYSRYILSMETKKAAELGNTVHDATDQAFRMQADQLRQNTVAVAKLSQRSVVSTDTLIHMQTQLIGSIDDAQKIIAEGRKARQDAAPKLQSLEQELIKRFNPLTK